MAVRADESLEQCLSVAIGRATRQVIPERTPAPELRQGRTMASAGASKQGVGVSGNESSNPARWIEDPTGRHELRYWNGSEWTEHVSDQGVVAADPLIAAPGEQVATETFPSVADAAPSAAWTQPTQPVPLPASRSRGD